MVDISGELHRIISETNCSPLLALIVIEDGLHIQESKSNKEFSRRLCDKRNLNTNQQAMRVCIHRDCK